MDREEPSQPEASGLIPEGATIEARALYIGERIDLKGLGPRLAEAPPVVRVGERGLAVIFRYGAVVLFNGDAADQTRLLEHLATRTVSPYEEPEHESVTIRVDASRRSGVSGEEIVIPEATVERLQIVAEILAKSIALTQHEESLAEAFDRIEPLATDLGRGARSARRLSEQIGQTLRVQHRMVGRIEVLEKPELLWEQSELERLYLRLEDHYELRERHVAIERKTRLISDTVRTALDLLQTRRSLRLEWYIVILIVIEILMMAYEMWAART